MLGTVYDSATRRPLVPANLQSVCYTPVGKDLPDRRCVRVAKDGTYAIDGLRPGTYVISGWPRPLVDTAGRRVTIEVLAGFFNNFAWASLFLFVLVMAFNMFSDALQDALDPKKVAES